MLFAQATDLIISEYGEGSSSNKYIEIFNGTGAAVDLSSYKLWKISNGGSWPEAEMALTGTLNDGAVYIVANPSADATILALANETNSSIAGFNGDDAIGLAKDDGTGAFVLIDAVGTDGTDPGSGWDVAGVASATANHTLVRKPDVTSPNTDWASSAGIDASTSEWIVYDSDYWDNLGSHTFGSNVDNPPTISNLVRDITVPSAGEDVVVSVYVDDDNTVASVNLNYSIDAGAEVSLSMSLVPNKSGTYSATIPSTEYSDGSLVDYYVSATDDAGQTTESSHSMFFAGLTTIDKVRENDADGYAKYKGAAARVQGVCTVESGIFSSSSIDVVIQDSTAGINVYAYGAGSDFTFVRGNRYTVVGEIDFYKGKTEIKPFDAASDITDNGVDVLPDFQVVTIADILADPESFESELIGIVGVSLVSGTWPSSGSNANLDISDNGTDIITLRVDKDTDLDDNPEPTWPVDVVGVLGQYDSSSPYDDGYQILPRDTSDIHETNTIPVELVSFAAQVSDEGVLLTWKTATEINNSGFEIEKSFDSESWNKIAFVEGNNGSEITSYSYLDKNIEASNVFYRLKQIDFDGTFEYSNIIEVVVDNPTKFELEQNYPNPFNPTTVIKFRLPQTANVELAVYNLLGQKVAELVNGKLEAGYYSFNFDASNLSNGIYFYELKADNNRSVKKMILQK